MRLNYTNLPFNNKNKSSTVDKFEKYQSIPMGIDPAVYAAAVGFFTSRGFDNTAAEMISEVIIMQAKQDGYNPMKILDTLRGLEDVDISGLVAEVLNYNRFKTSSLGYAAKRQINPEIERNIMA
jgi:hypothetical protein